MEVNLNSELTSEKYEVQQKFRQIENNREVKLLMAHDSQADVKVLRILNLDRNIRKVEKVREQKIQLEDYESKFDGMIFTEEMLENLAINYRLKLLNTNFYTGHIDSLTAPRLREFMDNNKISYETSGYADQFFILGPSEDFSKEDKEVKSKKSAMAFYKVDRNHYRLIHKWGNNFSLWRYVRAWKYRNAKTFVFNLFIFISFFLLSAVGYCFPEINTFSWFSWSFSLSGLITWLFYLSSNDNKNKEEGFLTKDNWKYIK